MNSFYGSLTDEQKARLLIGQARWSWGGRHERREAGGRGDPGYDRLFDDDRSERRDLGAGRWRDRRVDRPPAAGGAMAVTAKTRRGATMIATPGRTAVVRPRLLRQRAEALFVQNSALDAG